MRLFLMDQRGILFSGEYGVWIIFTHLYSIYIFASAFFLFAFSLSSELNHLPRTVFLSWTRESVLLHLLLVS